MPCIIQIVKVWPDKKKKVFCWESNIFVQVKKYRVSGIAYLDFAKFIELLFTVRPVYKGK